MAAKKRKVLKVFDFSEWALQDTARAPLPPVASSDPPPARWLGVQSLASIATGRDGKVIVCNAAKRDVHFELGYVEGHRQETHIVMPLDAPRAVMNLFSNRLAKKVLQEPSFVARLEEAGGGNRGLGLVIDGILAELDVCTPEEFEAMKAFCETCGFVGDKLPLRVSRVDGKLVMALIDAVMLAKKCTYDAAKHICHRLLLDYWHFDMEASGILEGPDLAHEVFHSLRLQEGSHGGRPTICVGAACLAEVLILIPGCELSAQLRKDMVKSFFGVGGNEVTFEGLLSNPRIQAHLRGSEHPLGEFLEESEHKALIRRLPRLLLQRDEDLKECDERWQQIVLARDEQWQQMVQHWQRQMEARDEARDDRIMSRMVQQCEQLSIGVVFAMQRGVTAALQPLLLSLQPLGELLGSLKGLTSSVSMSVRGAVKDVIDAAVTSTDSKLVKAFRAATKAPAKRSSADAAKFPASQRATPKQKVEALTLAKVACDEFPRRDLHYNTWKSVRPEYGKRAKAERLRRHALPVASPDFEPQPLLWCTGLVDGCKERYLHLEHHRAMLREVWHSKPPFGQSLHDWAVELQAAAVAEAGYVETEWPEDAAELEVFG